MIIETLKLLIEQIPEISNVDIEFAENKTGSYGLYSTGERVIKTSITGQKTISNNFVLFYFSDSFDNLSRIQNLKKLSEISEYLNSLEDIPIENVINNEIITEGNIKKIICSNAMLYTVPETVNDGYSYQVQIQVNYEK